MAKKKSDSSLLSNLIDKAKRERETEICLYCKKGEPDALLVFQVHAHVACHVADQERKRQEKEVVN